MNARITVCLLLVAVSAGFFCTDSEAGWHEFVCRSRLDWHRNNAWPQPFVQMDRLSACSPFVTMRQNGLCSDFTLGQHHFDQDSQTLTEAGRLKVWEILRRQPEGFNQLFVQRGFDEETSAIRLDSVQQTLARMIPSGPLPEVRFTEFVPRGMPASLIDAIGRKAEATTPDPRLPEFTGTTN